MQRICALDLNWLRDFDALAGTLNFTRAADARNVTQSAFSRRIKALENWVGAPLVNRARYPIQLTEAGRQFLPVARAMLAQLSETRQTIRDADRQGSRFIRISALHTLSVNYLAGRIDTLQALMPDLHTRVISDSLSSCCELLVEGAVDILLCYYHQSVAPQIDETAFTRRDLHRDPLIPVAASAPALARGWDLSQPGAAPLPHLAYEPASFLGLVVESITEGKPLHAETIYVDGLVEAIKRRVLRGSGFAWLPETAVAGELSQGQLVQIGGADWCTDLTIAALADPGGFDAATNRVWRAL